MINKTISAVIDPVPEPPITAPVIPALFSLALVLLFVAEFSIGGLLSEVSLVCTNVLVVILVVFVVSRMWPPPPEDPPLLSFC